MDLLTNIPPYINILVDVCAVDVERDFNEFMR